MAIPIPRRRVWPVLSILLFWAGTSPAISGDPPSFTYRTGVSEVRLSFSALDQDSHGVATLQASDFAVVDKDFIVRNFQSFTRSDSTKLEIAILADASESVTPGFRQEMAAILELLSQTTGVPDEHLSMFSFKGTQPTLHCTGDCRSSHAVDHFLATRAGGLTPLFDAVVVATDFLAQRADSHTEKVLIVLSDGEDTISRNSLTMAIDDAVRSDVRVFCINLHHSEPSARGEGILYSLAVETGGQYFSARHGAREAINVILEDFHASYTVTYLLPNHSSGFHPVRILPTRNSKLQFRSRSGYYYPSPVR